jgi:hypothetical protein
MELLHSYDITYQRVACGDSVLVTGALPHRSQMISDWVGIWEGSATGDPCTT